MRFGASKKVNEDGIASYMSLESLHNLWTMCRHLVSRGAVSMLKQINYYGSLDRSGKGQATQAFKDVSSLSAPSLIQAQPAHCCQVQAQVAQITYPPRHQRPSSLDQVLGHLPRGEIC